MKLSHLFVISLGFTFGFASAAQDDVFDFTGAVWATGVSEEDGWYDVNKSSHEEGHVESNMCYAAAASNLIAWWQDGEYGKALLSSAPKEHDAIWQTFVAQNKYYGEGGNSEEDDGGDPASSINWWISGVYYPGTDEEWNRYFASPESVGETSQAFNHTNGYYFDNYGLTKSDLADFVWEVWDYQKSEMSASEQNFTLYNIINAGGGISLGITSDSEDNPLEHAITLWGVEYVDGELTTMWLTDSDDELDRIFSVAVTVDEEDDKIYLGKWAQVNMEVEDENGVITEETKQCYFDDFYGEDVYIGGIYALNAPASANWQLVPEPSTATLSLLALAGLAMRRRRK